MLTVDTIVSIKKIHIKFSQENITNAKIEMGHSGQFIDYDPIIGDGYVIDTIEDPAGDYVVQLFSKKPLGKVDVENDLNLQMILP